MERTASLPFSMSAAPEVRDAFSAEALSAAVRLNKQMYRRPDGFPGRHSRLDRGDVRTRWNSDTRPVRVFIIPVGQESPFVIGQVQQIEVVNE